MVGLIVAVKADAFRRKARCQRCIQLSFRNDIQTHLLCIHDAADLFAAEGFAGIADHPSAAVEAVDRAAVASARRTNSLFVHNIQRGSILLRQQDGITTADGQMTLLVDT